MAIEKMTLSIGNEFMIFVISHEGAGSARTAKEAAQDFFGVRRTSPPPIFNIDWQPEETKLSSFSLVRRQLKISQSEWRLARVVGRSMWFKTRLAVSFALALARVLTAGRGLRSNKAYRENSLSDKHIKCMSRFVESSFKYLVVLEADALLEQNRITEWETLLELMLDNDTGATFVSLARAFDLSDLGVFKWERDSSGEFGRLPVGIANTTVAYCVNRDFAGNLLSRTLMDPMIRSLPSDIMMFEIMRGASEFTCLHSLKGIFSNSSLHGERASTIQ